MSGGPAHFARGEKGPVDPFQPRTPRQTCRGRANDVATFFTLSLIATIRCQSGRARPVGAVRARSDWLWANLTMQGLAKGLRRGPHAIFCGSILPPKPVPAKFLGRKAVFDAKTAPEFDANSDAPQDAPPFSASENDAKSASDFAPYTNRLTSTAARTKSANSGCGAKGFDFNSGWNCTPMNHG